MEPRDILQSNLNVDKPRSLCWLEAVPGQEQLAAAWAGRAALVAERERGYAREISAVPLEEKGAAALVRKICLAAVQEESLLAAALLAAEPAGVLAGTAHVASPDHATINKDREQCLRQDAAF